MSEVRVERIYRFPVKGLGGERLDRVYLTEAGIPYDRIVAFPNGAAPLQPHGTWTTYDAFHALTTQPELGLSAARVVAPRGRGAGGAPRADRECADRIEVTLGSDVVATISADCGQLRLAGVLDSGGLPGIGESQPVNLGVNLWDVPDAHISIINLASVRALSSRLGVELDPLRFRANFYIDGLPAWHEFAWVGKHLRIGEAQVAVSAPIERCRATSARPGGAVWDLNVPGGLAGHFGHVFCGLYARVERPAPVGTSARVRLTRTPGTHTGPSLLTVEPTAPRWGEVVAVRDAAPGTRALLVRDPTGLLASAKAGQYLRIHGAGEHRGWRNYTISGQDDGATRISVRVDPEGRFSPWLTSRAPSEPLLISGPYGDAVLPDRPVPVVLVSAGIGITPTLSMLQAMVRTGYPHPVSIIHVARALGDVPHWDEVLEAAERLDDCSVALFLTGHADEAQPARRAASPAQRSVRIVRRRPQASDLIPIFSRPDTELVVCGPLGFTTMVNAAASTAEVPRERLHMDPFYSPPDPDQRRQPAPSPGPWQVTWGDGSRTTWTDEDGTLLDHAETHGIRAPAACRAGVCGTCSARVSGKTAAVLQSFVSPKSADEQLLCSVVPRGDIEIDVAP